MLKNIAIETAENQLGNVEVSCGVTWSILMALRGIRHSEFASAGKSPRRIAERVLFC